jgi:uncharacterized membrane protein YcaP (DUF421 family)
MGSRSPLYLIKNEQIDHKLLKWHHLGMEDLNGVARKYSYANYDVFDMVILERGGSFTGVLKSVNL